MGKILKTIGVPVKQFICFKAKGVIFEHKCNDKLNQLVLSVCLLKFMHYKQLLKFNL